jgi:predicted ATPase
VHIKSLKLPKKFKRFTDLEIRNVPSAARFVLLLGPHGCGKSAVLEAIGIWHSQFGGRSRATGMRIDPEYLYQDPTRANVHTRRSEATLHFYEPVPTDPSALKSIIHQRSAYRFTRDVNATSLGGVGKIEDEHYVGSMIDADTRVLKNYQRLVSQVLSDLFDPEDDGEPRRELKQRHLDPLNAALQKVFPDIELTGFGRPPISGTFYFRKGDNTAFTFKNLSAGEREVFDLLLDAYVTALEDAAHVVCIDEPEVHMSIESQSRLVPALDALLPAEAQLWLATHSPGIISYSRQAAKTQPERFCFLDLGTVDPTIRQILEPVTVNGQFWARSLGYVLGELAGSVGPEKVMLCEGDPLEGKSGRLRFDQRVYSKVFAASFPDLSFVSVGSGSEIKKAKALARAISPDAEAVGVYDRDGKSAEEIEIIRQEGDRVLDRREFENYLLDDEVMLKLVSRVIPDAAETEKEDRLRQLRGILRQPRTKTADDDLKARANQLFNELNNVLPELTQTGSNVWFFMSDVLAPLITPDTEVYRELCECLGLHEPGQAREANEAIAR